jgi:hypothetical protein
MEADDLEMCLAEEEARGLSFKKKCEQGNADIVQLDFEVEQLKVEYLILFAKLSLPIGRIFSGPSCPIIHF